MKEFLHRICHEYYISRLSSNQAAIHHYTQHASSLDMQSGQSSNQNLKVQLLQIQYSELQYISLLHAPTE